MQQSILIHAMADKADCPGERYDGLTRLLHWIFAISIIYASVAGYSLRWIDDRPLHDFLSRLNVSLATLLIPLFPLRAMWKFVRTDPPPPAVATRDLRLARGVQNLLYVAIFATLASGFLMMPHGYMLFGRIAVPTPFEKGEVTAEFGWMHSVCTAVLSGLILVHIMGVLKHTLIKSVNILRRML